IFINQSKYILDILKRFGIENCDTVPTPMVEQAKLKLDLVKKPVDHTDYRSMIGSLISCRMSLRSKSTSDSVQFLSDNLVCWSSKKQNCVSISTAESEYVAVSSCCAQVLWMRTQLTDYGFFYDKIPIYCDSKSGIAISCNSVQQTRTKHIDVSHTAKEMNWHATGKCTEPGKMQHPVDGRAWKKFDTKYPDFAKEPRNVRLGLAADGFNPFGNLSRAYSMWPVILTTYNLPPWLCMKESSFMLTLLIPGPKFLGKDIDVYLRPLIEDLKVLWDRKGVETIDVASGQKFNMRTMVLWTINDFPARSSLSGWSGQDFMAKFTYFKVKGKLSDSIFNEMLEFFQNVFPISKGYKLPPSYYAIKKTFKMIGLGYESIHACEHDCCLFRGDDNKDLDLCPMCNTSRWKDSNTPGKKVSKKVLRYFLIIPILQCLYKSSHTAKEMIWHATGKCMEPGKMQHPVDGRAWKKFDTNPKSLGKDIDVYLRPLIKDLKVLWDRKGVETIDVASGQKFNMRAMVLWTINDFLAQSSLSRWSGQGYKACPTCNKDTSFVRVLSKTNYVGPIIFLKKPHKWRSSLEFNGETDNRDPPKEFGRDEILAQLDRLPTHVKEALEGGPIRPRWMFPFERYMKKLKSYVRNKAKPEGSIAEGYVAEEALTFSSHYFRDVTMKFNRPDRNVDPLPQRVSFRCSDRPEIDTYRSQFKSRDERRTTQNNSICSPGPDREMYHGQLQEILEFKYLLFRVVLFQVKWFDTQNQGPKVKRLVLRNNMIQINTRGETFKNDQYILITQVKQVFYIEDKAKPHWKVVEHVNHKKFSDEGVIVVEDDPDIKHFDNSSDLPLSTSLNDLDNATLHIDDSLPHDLADDDDDEDLINVDDDGVDKMSADVTRSHDSDGGGEDYPPPHYVPSGCGGCFANRGKGKQKANLGGRAAGKLNTRDKTRNLSLKEITNTKGPVSIRFELHDKQTFMPPSEHAAHWSSYIEEAAHGTPRLERDPRRHPAALVKSVQYQQGCFQGPALGYRPHDHDLQCGEDQAGTFSGHYGG
nr:hypothetical protein [Tanacetum cinerariifolium]